MERNEIVKALECCASPKQVCGDCPMPQDVKDDCRCMETISRNVLALIREFTIELDAMRGAANSYKMDNQRLTEDNERLKNSITFQVVMPDEKMEEIKAECLKRVELDVKECRADTVKKLLDFAIDNAVCKGNGDGTERLFISITELRDIAKELLEEEVNGDRD